MTSIIIVTYNKFDYNKLCIESIRQYTEPGSYEIIVVDNNSTDGTVEWLQRQPDIRLICNRENVGFPAGCNQGMAVAGGDSILLLNNDTIVTPQWLTNLKKCLFNADDIGAVGAVTNSCSNFQSIPTEYASIEEMIGFARQINHSDPELWEERARLVGYCMLIKAEVVRKIGLLDEFFSPGNYEDDDYSLRIRNAGYRLVLCRDTFIHHFGSVSFGERTDQFNHLLETNKQRFTEKWGIAPFSILPSNRIQDTGLKQWFTYQHDYHFYRQLMENARYKFGSLVNQAEFAFLSGDQEKAMLTVMRAADSAHHSHPGFFTSPRLESILRKIAEKLEAKIADIFPAVSGKQRVKRNILHVISQGYAAGGHTKALERWILMDTQSVHSILVTLNSATNPPWLASAAMQSGGWYHSLADGKISLTQRARLLRDMANRWADVVVLHGHPHDPIPPVAFGVAGGPPVIFVNHADQAFSIGMPAADLIAEHRAAGQAVTQARRKILRSRLLPLPLGMPHASENKQIVRQKLGIDEDGIVMLTVAHAYQLVPCGEYHFINLLAEISNRYPNVVALIIGPSESPDWARLNSESGGRIRLVAPQSDLGPYRSAADVYLDSLPLGSFAEALEAGALGMPVVGLATAVAGHLSGNIQPDALLTHFPSREELFAVVDRLVGDPVYRREQGDCLQAAVLQNHCSGWCEKVAELYSLVPDNHVPADIPVDEVLDSDWNDVVWSYFQRQSGLSNCRFD